MTRNHPLGAKIIGLPVEPSTEWLRERAEYCESVGSANVHLKEIGRLCRALLSALDDRERLDGMNAAAKRQQREYGGELLGWRVNEVGGVERGWASKGYDADIRVAIDKGIKRSGLETPNQEER